MKDIEIIKALECCKTGNCDECPFYGVKEDCEVELPEEALNLINRQKAEIERERHLNDKKRLDYEIIRYEARKEFADRLKSKKCAKGSRVIYVDRIIETLKEMEVKL